MIDLESVYARTHLGSPPTPPHWSPKTVLVNNRGEQLWRDWVGHQCSGADERMKSRALREQAAQLTVRRVS